MAITRNIVDMMGGTISLTSKEGKGTEFIVTLNFKTLEKATVYGPIPKLVGARALVVDDDVHTCTSVSKMLREIEMRADWSTSGKEAGVTAFVEKPIFMSELRKVLTKPMNIKEERSQQMPLKKIKRRHLKQV